MSVKIRVWNDEETSEAWLVDVDCEQFFFDSKEEMEKTLGELLRMKDNYGRRKRC